MAQIAKAIAVRLNETEPKLRKNPIDVDVVEFAGLCHDLGHSPFGHQGEEVLDSLMRDSGGFEGNAQTLRLIARLEKRQRGPSDASGLNEDGADERYGLNLSARTIAAVLKYDRPIPREAKQRSKPDKVAKGYYESERDVVRWVKGQVVPRYRGSLKTIECQIMDVADDIAYSTYDLEDTFKAGFLNPLDLLALEEFYPVVAQKVAEAIEGPFSPENVRDTFLELFEELAAAVRDIDMAERTAPLAIATFVYTIAQNLGRNGYSRADFTSRLIRMAIDGVKFKWNSTFPALSTVELSPSARRRVEVLKHFTFEATIKSSRVSVSQFRAHDILETIFAALLKNQLLLPDDVQRVFGRSQTAERPRVICDFIAGMTDRYAIEFFGRLKSENPETIFKPL